jgi:hypothetical protein
MIDYVSPRAAEMTPDGGLAELRVRLAKLEASAKQAGLASGVDDDLGFDEVVVGAKLPGR